MGTNGTKKEPLPKLYYLTATLTSAAVSGANTYVPFYLRSLGATYFLSGLPLVVRGIGRVAFDVSSIYLMGRLHPQSIFLWGVALGAIALLVCGVIPSAYAVIATYFFVGVGMAMLHIALRQLVFEGSTRGRRGRAMGLLSVFIGSGPIMGIALGGVIAEYLGYRSLFLSAGAVILWLPLAIGYFVSPEPSLARGEETGTTLRLGIVREIIGTPGAPLLCACSFFSLFYQQARGLAVAFFSTDVVGLSLGSYGLMRSISQLGNVSGRYFGGGWTDKSGIGACLVAGFLISALGYGMIALSSGFWSLLLVHTTIGVGAGMVNVGSQVGIMSIVPGELRGQAMGLYRSVGDVGMLIGPVLITSSLERLGFVGSFTWMAIVPLFLASSAFLNRRELREAIR